MAIDIRTCCAACPGKLVTASAENQIILQLILNTPGTGPRLEGRVSGGYCNHLIFERMNINYS